MEHIPCLIKIKRWGEFSISSNQSTLAQCAQEQALNYKYNVEIQSTNESLVPPHNFVIDNMLIKAYFETYYVIEKNQMPSCEDAVQNALDYFVNVFKDIFPCVKVKNIRVTLSGSQYSEAEAYTEF